MVPRAKTSGELIIGMTDRDVIDRFRSVFGVGRITTEVRADPHLDCHRWSVSTAAECTMVLEAMLPWFGARRTASAKSLLERMKACRGARVDRTHCKHGHEYTEANIRWVYGSRRCRICERSSNDKYFAAKKLEKETPDAPR